MASPAPPAAADVAVLATASPQAPAAKTQMSRRPPASHIMQGLQLNASLKLQAHAETKALKSKPSTPMYVIGRAHCTIVGLTYPGHMGESGGRNCGIGYMLVPWWRGGGKACAYMRHGMLGGVRCSPWRPEATSMKGSIHVLHIASTQHSAAAP